MVRNYVLVGILLIAGLAPRELLSNPCPPGQTMPRPSCHDAMDAPIAPCCGDPNTASGVCSLLCAVSCAPGYSTTYGPPGQYLCYPIPR